MQLNYYPGLRRLFTVRGFSHFFEKTMDNYSAVAEGKYEAIGRPWLEMGS
jgi:hypothetical protein